MEQEQTPFRSFGWKELYQDFNVIDVYPTDKFAKFLATEVNGKHKGAIVDFDFSGIDCITDEVFVALSESCEKTKLGFNVRSIRCAGCVHLTDFAVRQISTWCPNLETLNLDGCPLITEYSLALLTFHCQNIKSASVVGCDVSTVPKFDHPVTLTLDGNPLLSETPGDKSSTWDLTQNKLVIMGKDNLDFNIFDFLTGGAQAKFIEVGKKSMNYAKDIQFKVGEHKHTINVFECKSRNSLYSPILSPRGVYVVAVDMDKTTQLELFIMSRIDTVKGVAHNVPFIILCVHKEGSARSAQTVDQLGKDLEGYFFRQAETLKSHLDTEHFENKKNVSRDFAAQQRYSRSVLASKAIYTYNIFRVNVDTLEVEQHWPKQAASEPDTKLEDEVKQLEAELNEFNERSMEPALHAIQGIQKGDLSEMKSYNNPPVVAVLVMEAVLILFNHKVPDPSSGKQNVWPSANRYILGDSALTGKIINYDKDSITKKHLDKLKPIVTNPNISTEKVSMVSRAAAAMWMWVEALYEYGSQLKPKVEVLQAKVEQSKQGSTGTQGQYGGGRSTIDAKLQLEELKTKLQLALRAIELSSQVIRIFQLSKHNVYPFIWANLIFCRMSI